MYTLSSIADFLLGKWLWSMTFDWYHLFINLFLMAFLFRGMSHSVYARSFLFSLLLQLFAFGMFTLFAVGVLHYGIGWEYVHPDVPQMPVVNYVIRACLSLGVIYSVFQTLFIAGMYVYCPFRTAPYLLVIWMGNFIATVLSYCCILIASSINL